MDKIVELQFIVNLSEVNVVATDSPDIFIDKVLQATSNWKNHIASSYSFDRYKEAVLKLYHVYNEKISKLSYLAMSDKDALNYSEFSLVLTSLLNDITTTTLVNIQITLMMLRDAQKYRNVFDRKPYE